MHKSGSISSVTVPFTPSCPFSYGQSKVPFPHLEIMMSGGYISQKIEDEVLCFGIAFYKRRCIVKKNRVLEVPRLLAVIETDDWGTFLKSE